MLAAEALSRVHAAADASELVRAAEFVAADGGIRLCLPDARLRPLAPDEIRRLESQGNSAEDWSRVRVAEEFDPRAVRHSSFHGDVVLGRFARRVPVAESIELPSGIDHSTIANSVVGHDTLVRHVKLLANCVVGPGATLVDCGSVTCEGETTFGNAAELPIAIEVGGRDVQVYAEIDVEVAAAVARLRSDGDFLGAYASAIDRYKSRVTSRRGIIEQGAVIRNTPTVRNSYVGPHAQIDGATLVADSTLLSSRDEPVQVASGACVKASLLQWGSHVATMAIVDTSVLTEHSHVDRHGIVTGSILGPNTGVAEGEVTASLLGPFVGFHHQALLIAVLWPEGKGNVGYGANVGSNHTSKAPDQEFWPGEGLFLGLGVNIKYPADFTRAPYTIIASGVTTLPQKITFPFSLVNSPATSYADVSPAYNEIVPAWLLTDNMYTLKRNEGKYKARNKAKRTRFVFDVFRPDTVELMRDACQRLESVRQVKEIYTDRDIDGLGKNFMLEANRKPAIEAYRFYVEYYALMGLKARVAAALETASAQAHSLLTSPSDDPQWEHQRGILHDEFGFTDVVDALEQLPNMVQMVASDVERSKAKDDERGRRIIDDYAAVHAVAAKDKFVVETWETTRRLQQEVHELIERLGTR